jgi:hypothetical protein
MDSNTANIDRKIIVPPATISAYRSKTFYSLGGDRVTNLAQAIDYINERGFILFWPNKNTLCPSLWTVVAGDRPVPDEHDDPGHVTWGWKDSLLDKKSVFYARVIKQRNTFISLELLPSFYALSPNYGSPEEDYLIDYEAGRLTAEARNLYEAILTNGPLDTIALRKTARMTNKSSDAPFNKALTFLQSTLRILPVGIAEAGAWKYAFIYDLVPRQFPWIIEKAHPIGEWDARRAILKSYLSSVGAARSVDIARILGWTPLLIERAAQKLINSGDILNAEIEGSSVECLAVPTVCQM